MSLGVGPQEAGSRFSEGQARVWPSLPFCYGSSELNDHDHKQERRRGRHPYSSCRARPGCSPPGSLPATVSLCTKATTHLLCMTSDDRQLDRLGPRLWVLRGVTVFCSPVWHTARYLLSPSLLVAWCSLPTSVTWGHYLKKPLRSLSRQILPGLLPAHCS